MEINPRFPVFPRTDLFVSEMGQDEHEDDLVIMNLEEVAHHLSQSGHKNILSRSVRSFNVAQNLINPSE